MPLQKAPVAGGPPGGMQSDQVERCRIRGAVVGRVWDQLEMRKFAVSHLMQNLAGLGIAVGVVIARLQGAEDLQSAGCKLRIDENVLQRDDQAVASKGRHE